MDSEVTTPTEPPQHSPELAAIAGGTHVDPHRILGPHIVDGQVLVRALRPMADAVVVVTPEGSYDARHVQDGVWELFVPGVGAGARYKFQILGRDGAWREKADPMAKGTELPSVRMACVAPCQWLKSPATRTACAFGAQTANDVPSTAPSTPG